MQVVSLVITGLTASAVLAQEEAEKNCDFECPTKGNIINHDLTSPHCSLLTRWEFR